MKIELNDVDARYLADLVIREIETDVAWNNSLLESGAPVDKQREKNIEYGKRLAHRLLIGNDN